MIMRRISLIITLSVLLNSMCNPLGGVIFSDLVTDLERCSDHAINLAYALKERPSELDAPKLV